MKQQKHAIAVKAFLVYNRRRVLLLRRRPDDPHSPGQWDLPGGRLNLGEDPYIGLDREVFEETHNRINIQAPLDVHHFTRDDGQVITMIIFWCTTPSNRTKLSEEHTHKKWVDVYDTSAFPDWIKPIAKRFQKEYS